jgi:flagellar hook protein FlgE
VDKDGFLSFNYSNGESRKIYKIPLADFPNQNGLNPTSGNAYTQGDDSGDFTLKQAGDGGVGVFSPKSLENSGTELSGELTDLIVAQRSYEANTKIITTTDSLLETLTQILR